MTKFRTEILRAGALCALLVMCSSAQAQNFDESFSGTGAEDSGNVVLSGFEEPNWTLGLSGGGAGATAVFDIPNGELDVNANDTTPASFLARPFAGTATATEPLETTLFLNDLDITNEITASTNILVFAIGDNYSASILDINTDPNDNWIASIVAMGAVIAEPVAPMVPGTNVSFGWTETSSGLVDFLYDNDTTDATAAVSLVQFTNPCATASCATDDTNRNNAFSFFPATPAGVMEFGLDRYVGSIGAVIPEPTSIVLFGFGALASLTYRRRS